MNILRLSTLSLTLAIAVFALGYVNPSFAGKPDKCPDHPSCKDGGDAKYSVAISGDVLGNSVAGYPWSKGGGRNTINSPPYNAGFLTDLSFFAALPVEPPPPFTAGQATVCFAAGTFPLYGGFINQGKKGTAQANFWFFAKTYDGIPPGSDPITVLYQLTYTGVFASGWLPEIGSPAFLNMNEWRLHAENEGDDIKAISCIGEGTTNVMITVELL